VKVQTVTPYRVSHLQRYGVTVRGNVTGMYPPLEVLVSKISNLPANIETAIPIQGLALFKCFLTL
jgi:hypothetical protein